MAVASTFKNHIVIVGLGHLGYRVAKNLIQLDKAVVVIDINPDANLTEIIHQSGAPIIKDDASRESILLSASIENAESIVLCTQNDSLNLQVALKARQLNPEVGVVIRIFDDDFAQSMQQQFGFRALSATGMAAPIFAASAAKVDITPPISIEKIPHSLAKIHLSSHSKILNQQISQIEKEYEISIVMLNRQGQIDFHPAGDIIIQNNDEIAILGTPDCINRILQKNC